MHQLSTWFAVIISLLFAIKAYGFRQTQAVTDTVICNETTDNQIYTVSSEFVFVLRKNMHQLSNYESDTIQNCSADSLELILKMNISGSCFFDQTMISYSYLSKDSILDYEITGLVENKKQIWIHPPRGFFKEMELAPYPEIRFKRKKWKSGFISTRNSYKGLNQKFILIRNKHLIKRDGVEFLLGDDFILCKEVFVISKFRGQKFVSKMLFNEIFGFVFLDLSLINGDRFMFRLIDYTVGNERMF